ncbi:MAG: protein translocase subunit SecF [Actinomycetota bacterium]
MSLRGAIASFRGQREFHVEIIGRRRLWFLISSALVALSIAGFLVRGFNLGIDFLGGATLSYRNETGARVDEIRSALAGVGHPDALVQLTGEDGVRVRTESLASDREEVLQALADQAGIVPSEISVEDVGPKWGQQISIKALQGLVIFLILASIYITFRFEWKMAVGAQMALFHDLIITAGVYALLGREVSPETVIAILTILGYSLYDTVVIFDKIQENAQSTSLVAKETYSGVVNLSLNQVLMRSVNTSLTTLLPIGTLLLFGGETLEAFAFALFVGVGVGTYSSLFVAAPVVAVLKEREPKLAEVRERVARREDRPGPPAVPAAAKPAAGRELVGATAPASPKTTARPASQKRKPKKKKPRSKRRKR